jgi:hypothetical protein
MEEGEAGEGRMTTSRIAYHQDRSKPRVGQIYTIETALEWRAMLKNPGNGIKPLNMRQLEIKLGLPRNTVTKILDKFGV